MSTFEQLVPGTYHYFKKFAMLDEMDLRIVHKMAEGCPEGPRNVRKIAKDLKLPQQTVNYRILRIDSKDLVRFRAVPNENLLGLKNYSVIATTKPGLLYETDKGDAVNAGTFLTCYPIWRSTKEIVGSNIHGFFVQYAIPHEKERDLKLFLRKLEKVKCISRIDDFCEVTQTLFNKPSLDLHLSMRKALGRQHHISFKWEEWINDFAKAKEAVLPKEKISEKVVLFSYTDLQILSCLEENLRMKFVEIAKRMGEPNSKIPRWFKEIIRSKLISDCRAEICATNPKTSMHLVVRIEFSNDTALGKFISHLDRIPYSVSYQQVIQQSVIFLYIAIPPHEYLSFRNVFDALNRKHDIIRDYSLYVSNYVARWDNIKLYETFSKTEKKWEFSFEVIDEVFEKLRSANNFQF